MGNLRDMGPEEFRAAGHELIDWIADYRARIPELPVQAQVGPGEVAGKLPANAPEEAEPFSRLLADLDSIVVPGVTQVQHPRYFGWFPSNATLSSALGDLATAGIGALGITWQSAPALTEVEEVVVEWLRELTGLPESWKGVIQDTASTACLVALLVARERATDYSEVRGGLQAESAPLTVYTTEHAHSSVPKAVALAGFGRDNLRLVGVDPVNVRDAPGGAGQGPRRRRRSRAPPGRRRGQRRHHRDHGRGPAGRDRPAGPAVRDVGARRRGHGRLGPAAAGDALAGRRRRRRGLAELEPAQVAGHPGGLLAALRGGPGRPDPGHVDQPVLPAVRGRRRGDPVQGLGHPARPPVPRAQAVVPPAAGRGRGHPGPAAPGPGQRPLARRAGRGGPRLAGPRPGRPADRRAQARTRRAQARTPTG